MNNIIEMSITEVQMQFKIERFLRLRPHKHALIRSYYGSPRSTPLSHSTPRMRLIKRRRRMTPLLEATFGGHCMECP